MRRRWHWLVALLVLLTACAAPTKTPSAQPTATSGVMSTAQSAVTSTALQAEQSTQSAQSSAMAASTPTPSGPVLDGPYPVTEVVDGDTIKVILNGRIVSIRLIGMDTPELRDPRKPVQCYAAEAARFTQDMIARAGNRVLLERDVSETDQYGRLLRYVWLDQPDGRRMLNYELVAQGYAQVLTIPPDVKYAEWFRQAQAQAQAQRRGLWGACPAFGAPAATPTPLTSSASPAATTVTSGIVFVSVSGGPPGGTALVVVQTRPGAHCTIQYRTPAGTASQAQGLMPRDAGADGRVSWSWKIGSSTRPGTGTVTVTCDGVSASHPITIG